MHSSDRTTTCLPLVPRVVRRIALALLGLSASVIAAETQTPTTATDSAATAPAASGVGGLSPGITLRFARAAWIRATNPKPDARVLYVFADPQCPYCHRLWQDLQAHGGYGMEVRYLMVAVIDPEKSKSQAAAILQAPDPTRALTLHEARFAQGGINPAANITDETRETLSLHRAFMDWLGVYATPAVVFDAADGRVSILHGIPSAEQLHAIAAGKF